MVKYFIKRINFRPSNQRHFQSLNPYLDFILTCSLLKNTLEIKDRKPFFFFNSVKMILTA